MPKMKTWKSIPIENEIINALIENRGEMLTTDLFRKLSLLYKDYTKEDMMQNLFCLEVRSFIHVVNIKKDVSKIEISRSAQFSNSFHRRIMEFMH